MFKIVRIKWYDHSSFNENTWHDLEDTLDNLQPFSVETVGFLLAETDECYLVCGTFSEDSKKTNGEFCILKGTVLSYEVLVNV